jgi:hypothetical protein
LPIPVSGDVDLGTFGPFHDRDPWSTLLGRDPAVRTTSVADATDDSLRLYLHSTRCGVAPLGLWPHDLERLEMTRVAVEAELRRRVVLGRSPPAVLSPTVAVAATFARPVPSASTAGRTEPQPASSTRGAPSPRPRYGGKRFTISAEEKQVVDLWDIRTELGLSTFHDLLEHLGRKGITGWTLKRIKALLERVAKKRRRDALRATRRT